MYVLWFSISGRTEVVQKNLETNTGEALRERYSLSVKSFHMAARMKSLDGTIQKTTHNRINLLVSKSTVQR